jgi:mixed-linked glucan synthase
MDGGTKDACRSSRKKKKTHAALGLLFNVWIMVLLHPFVLAIMGRLAKRPIVLVVLLPVVFVVVGMIYVALHILLANVFPI